MGGEGGCQGRCELSSEVFVKIQIKNRGGGGGGGVRVDGNAMLGVGGDVGYG